MAALPLARADRGVILTLPIPPSANNLFVNGSGAVVGQRRRFGRMLGVPYKLWLHDAGWAIKLQCGAFAAPLIPGLVSVDIRAPLNRRRDLDNALKPTLDLLVRMGIISDDNLIDDLRIRRAGTGDQVTIEIRAMA
jgi:hypothetical protein